MMGATVSSESKKAHKEIKGIVIDDDELVGDVIELYMTASGIHGQRAPSPEAAIEALTRGPIDLVFMDLQLGRDHGTELTRRIREMDIQQPVIIGMSGDASVSQRHEALESGMDEFLDKPIYAEDIELMVGRFFSEPELPGEIRQKPSRPVRSNSGALPPFLNTDRVFELRQQNGHLNTYLESYASSCRFIRHHLWVARQQTNFDKVGQLIHRLKGAAAILGDTDIESMSELIRQRLEGNPDAGVQEGLSRILTRLEHSLAHRLDDIHRYLESDRDVVHSVSDPSDGIGDVTRRLRETLVRHRIPDPQDVNQVVEHLTCQGKPMAAESLRCAIDQYDFTQAGRILGASLQSP